MKYLRFGAYAPVLLAVACAAGPAVLAQGEATGRAEVHRSGTALGPGLPGDPFARPRYVVHASRIRAIDETGPDFWGSDEIVLDFQVNNLRVTSAVYGDFDTGDDRAIRTENRCIAPLQDPDGTRNNAWDCLRAGQGGVIAFLITLYEHDGVIRTLPGEFCAGFPDDLSGDCGLVQESTVIGSTRVSFSEADLAGDMPNVGDQITRTMIVFPCKWDDTNCGFVTGWPGDGTYEVDYQITRVTDEISGGQPIARARVGG